MKPTLPGALALALSTAAFAQPAPPPPKPGQLVPAQVLASAPASAWKAIDPDNLLVMDLKSGGRVVIALAPAFAPVHVANIRTMARAHYLDGWQIVRVQENYVTQWGIDEEKTPPPSTIVANPPLEYERPAAGLDFHPLPYRDAFAAKVGFVGAFPVAEEGGSAWLTHCYAMVGVGRDLKTSGNGAELYVANSQGPRGLDRNIAVAGRVLSGMESLTALPRGTEALGFYKDASSYVPFARVRLASDMPEGERPHFVTLDPAGPSFAAWVNAKANRIDDFFVHAQGAVDLCNALPPVKELK